MRTYFFLLPAYNEAAALETLVPAIAAMADERGWPHRILVADDGSSDATPCILADQARRFHLEVLRHKYNRGLGETSRDLFERVAELAQNEDVIVRMDCDDTHEPAYVPQMVAKLDEGYDVVIASRFQPGGGQAGVPGYRAFVSRSANLLMKLFFPIRGLREYSSGFRAYRAAVIRRAVARYRNDFIQLKGLGFTCTLEKLLKLKLLGARFAEVPFTLQYGKKQSTSKMVTSITTLGYLVLLVMYYWPWGGWRRTYGQAFAEEPWLASTR